jgi:hypothetical protein
MYTHIIPLTFSLAASVGVVANLFHLSPILFLSLSARVDKTSFLVAHSGLPLD